MPMPAQHGVITVPPPPLPLAPLPLQQQPLPLATLKSLIGIGITVS